MCACVSVFVCVGGQHVGQLFVAVVMWCVCVCELQCNHQPYVGSSEVIWFVSDVFIHPFTLLSNMSHAGVSLSVGGHGGCLCVDGLYEWYFSRL